MSSFFEWFNVRPLITYIRFKLRLPRDRDNMETTIELVRNGANMTGSNLWVLVTAIFTASLGLNVNSTAVIIGAMLISPLMGPIVAIGMGVAIHDFGLVYRALKNFALAVGLSILTSTVYFLISPLKVPGSELLARTSPTVYDVLIAIVGGLAGIIAGSSKLRQSNVVPGVAIATALMPPLCTVGFGIANLNITYILGAFYLFFINTVFISLATYGIVRFLKYPTVQPLHGRRAHTIRRLIVAIVTLALLPSIYLTYLIVRKYIFEERVKAFVQEEFQGSRRIVLQSEALYEDAKPIVRLTLLGAELDSTEQEALRNRMRIYGIRGAALELKQGFGGLSRNGSVIGSIQQSIDANAQAINSLQERLNDIYRQPYLPDIPDSVQLSLARVVRDSFPGLTAFALRRHTVYDAGRDTLVKGWEAVVVMKPAANVQNTARLRRFLAPRVGGDTLVLRME